MLKIKRPIVSLGFSLLELLLVIVIIAGIASFGFATFREYANNARIKQTAEQIQTLEQAAAAYFVDSGSWPASCNDPTFSSYLPNANLTNPFGSAYTCQVSGGGKKFAVLSGVISVPGALQQIGNLLPSAAIQQNQIVSEIVVPFKQQTQQSGYLLKLIHETVVSFSTSSFVLQNTPSFTCPAGWIAASTVVLKGIYPDPWNFNVLQGCPGYGPGSKLISHLGAYVHQNYYDLNNNTNTTCITQSTAQNGEINYICQYYAQFVSNYQNSQINCNWFVTGGGSARFVEFGYCIPPQKQQSTRKLF